MRDKKYFPVLMMFFMTVGCSKNMNLEEAIQQAIKHNEGAIVFTDLKTEKIMYSQIYFQKMDDAD